MKIMFFNIPQSGHESVYVWEPSFHLITPTKISQLSSDISAGAHNEMAPPDFTWRICSEMKRDGPAKPLCNARNIMRPRLQKTVRLIVYLTSLLCLQPYSAPSCFVHNRFSTLIEDDSVTGSFNKQIGNIDLFGIWILFSAEMVQQIQINM